MSPLTHEQWSPNVYRGNNMFELHDSEDRLIGRLEAINSSHTTLLSELREVIKVRASASRLIKHAPLLL